MVYFLAPDEIESVPSSSRPDSGLKLMKTFCGTKKCHDYFITDREKLIFYEIGKHKSAEISSVIYTNDGTEAKYKSDFFQANGDDGKPQPIIFTFKVLPNIGIANIVNAGIF